MSVRVTCPACDTTITVNDDKRGGKVRCKQCAKAISVPAPTNGKAKSAPEENGELDFRSLKPKAGAGKKKTPAKKGFPVLWAVGGGLAAVLMLVGAAAAVGAYLYWRKTPDAPAAQAKTETGQTEHQINPDPKKERQKEAAAKKDPEPAKTGTEPLSPELQKVKDATVFISADQLRSAGSGFFAVEPGLVITSADVLGMTDPNSPPPQKIDVFWNVGAPNEMSALGTIVAVDPIVNLAALRVAGANLPGPLPFEDSSNIAEAQNVHIAGFPFGPKISKDFALTPTAIAKVKKDGDGRLADIRVNAGMNRGNAGGPVVTPLGNVVGVGTGALRDPQVHAAIPVDVVKRFLDPRIGDAVFGKPFTQGGQTKVRTKYPLTDPLGRIKDVRVELWTGLAAPPRPYSYKPPVPVDGDGPRMPQPLTNQKTFANNDLVMPPLASSGQVVWVQAIITCSDNSMQWSVATPITVPPSSPYQLIPANLTLNLTTPKERTVTLNYTLTPANMAPTTGTANILEVLGPDPAGAQMRTAFGTLTNVIDPAGKNMPAAKQVLDLVHQVPTTFFMDKTGLIRRRTDRPFDKDPPAGLKEQAIDQQFQIASPFEAQMVPMPNRTVQPGETWPVTYYMRARAPKKPGDNLQLTLTATYLGTQKKDDRSEAVITVTGKVTTANPDLQKWQGSVNGKLGFDTSGGYLSSGKLTLSADGNAGYTLDLDFQRVAGNGMNIQFPQAPITPVPPPPPPPPPSKKAKVVLEKKESLTTKDLVDNAMTTGLPMKKKAHVKDYFVPMQMGKTYTITLNSGAFDAFLKLYGPTNNSLAQDDNGGGGTNAKIVYRATATGQYRVSAISKNGNTGAFHLTVTETP